MKIKCFAVAQGRVQGVGFRYFVLRAAAALGVGGWVRNCCDGSVEMYLHGEQAAVEQLLQKIRAGTVWIQVDSLDVRRVSDDQFPDESEFSVKY